MGTITADTTPTFPVCPGYGFTVDPFFLVKIITREGGFELVDRKWSQARREFNGVPIGDKPQEDIEQILYFWLAMGGMSTSFRFKDFTDFKSCKLGETIAGTDQPLVSLGANQYQITKRYTVGSITHTRNIYRPIGSTLIVVNELGAVQTSWTLNEATGVITKGGAFTGTPTAAGFEFDVLCRFNASFAPQIVDQEIQNAEVSLIEKREGT